MKKLGLLLLVLFFVLLIGVALFWFVDNKLNYKKNIDVPVIVSVERGMGVLQIANQLEKNNVIDDARLLVLYIRYLKLANQIKAGEYQFVGKYSIKDVVEKIVKGMVIVRSITIPEGKALVEIKKIINDNPYLTGDITLEVKEGEILPETYNFNKGETRNGIIEKARKDMKKVLREAFLERNKEIPIKNEEELLILASIVEKETGVASERAKVASVFINRLNLGMRLQTDPTVIYAVTGGKMDLGRPIYKRDLVFDSPYNTYVYGGLPPAPICSPGIDAIKAVANPDKTKYLYFVADGITGGHLFAKSLAEHNKNVARYRSLKK